MSSESMSSDTSNIKIVRASAGSGKTYFLTSEIIKLIKNNEDPKNILSTTFTRKSAGEIFGRVISRLSSDQESSKTLLNLLKNQDFFKISTLDSFIGSIAKAFFLELGLPENWKVTEDKKIDEINKQALSKSFQVLGIGISNSIISLMLGDKHPGRPSKKVLEEIKQLSNLYIISTNETWENKDLIEKYITSYNYNDLLKELTELVDSLDEKLPQKKPFIKIKNLFIENKFETILAETIIKTVKEGTNIYNKKPLRDEDILLIKKLISFSKNYVIKKLASQTKSINLLLTSFLEERKKIVFEQGLLSFNDVTEIVSEASRNIDLIDIFSRLDNTINHILIDEFQDTSPLQWTILEPIAENILSSRESNKSFITVGDLKQAIYGFRGGASEIFSYVKDKFKIENESTLETSYRSNPKIIKFLNLIFDSKKHNDSNLELWLKDYNTHIANKKTSQVDICVKKIESDQILDSLVSDIKNIMNKKQGIKIAVLVNNNDKVISILRKLEEQGIKGTGIGKSLLGESFFSKIISSILKLANNLEKKLSLAHLISLPEEIKNSIGVNLDLEDETKSIRDLSYILRIDGLFNLANRVSLSLLPVLSSTEKEKVKKILSVILEFERSLPGDNLELIKILDDTKFEQPESSSIIVSTIHGSKGLEYDYVFLPYTSDKFIKTNNKDKFLVDQENNFTKIKRIIKYPITGTIPYFPELSEIIKTKKNKEIKENFSVCYVALTRAVEGLYIYLDKETKNSGEINSLSDLITSALDQDDQENEILYKEECLDTEIKKEEYLELPEEDLNNLIIKKESDIPSFTKFKTGLIKAPSKSTIYINNEDALSFGTNVHKCLSKIKWLNKIDSEEVLIKSSSFIEKIEDRNRIIDYLRESLSDSSVFDLFNVSNYSKEDLIEVSIFNELKFSHKKSNSIVSGIIDRIVISKTEDKELINIIDFKTDKIIEEDKYTDQLNEYFDFAIKKWPNAKIKTSLVYLGLSKIITVNQSK